VRSRLAQGLALLLGVDDTPHRTALAFGVGLFIAFFPLVGIHTGLALAIAFAFRLSRVAILAGAWCNNPWTLGPMMSAGTGLGCWLLGVPLGGLAHIDWTLDADFLRDLAVGLRPYLWPYVVGNMLTGVLVGAVGYFLVRRTLERRRRVAVA
jgi:uncharacterized protein (DUF2062 family)